MKELKLNRSLLGLVLLTLWACASPQSQHSKVDVLPGKKREQYESFGTQAMVSTQGVHSTQAGIEVMKKGGNIFDAFAAISFAISVERPHSTGIGGGGFLVFYNAKEKKVYAFDFREMAPRRASADMFLNANGEPDKERSLTGAFAVATPGLVAGVLEVHKKYGKLPLPEVMRPAIELAEKGFPVYPALHEATQSEKARLAMYPSSKSIFLTPEGEPWPVGHQLIQADLAATLKLIAEKGKKGFYAGSVAKNISNSIKAYRGLLDEKDLAAYKTKWRTPVRSTYKDYEIYSQPPPSSGGSHVIQILNILEKDKLKDLGPQHPRAIHLTASAMQRAFVDRALYMGDPDFVKVPVQKITSKEYASELRKKITDKATPSKDLLPKELSEKNSFETTHFSIMDAEGNAVASTQTINGWFGSALVAGGTGIMLNNEMDDFAAKVGASNLFGAIGGTKNRIEPLKRPLSSMSPTIVVKDGRAFLSVGTPSGTRIITCVAQTLLNVLEYELPLWESVTLTRYHHQWMPDQLSVEAPSFTAETLKSLTEIGHNVQPKDLGCKIQVIKRDGETLHGVSDPREEGSSLGL